MIAMTVAVLLAAAAGAGMSVNDGDEVTVAVGANGVTVRLPEFVRVVTPSAGYDIRPLAAPRPAQPGANGASAPAAATDVRVFVVRALRPQAADQPVTFLMADDRSLTVNFVPAAAGAREDGFVDLRWEKRAAPSSGRVLSAGDQFLSAERSLLVAMLRDDRAVGRKVLQQPVALAGHPDLEVVLVRTFESEGLVGAVYTVRNTSSETVQLNQTVLALGKPNRAVLTQMDHGELRSCKEDNSPDPRGSGCMTALRVVARSGVSGGVGSLRVEHSSAAMPFVLANPKDRNGDRR